MAAAAPPHHLRSRRRLCCLRLARSVAGPAGRGIRAARRPGRRRRAAGPGLTAAVWLAICSGQAALAPDGPAAPDVVRFPDAVQFPVLPGKKPASPMILR